MPQGAACRWACDAGLHVGGSGGELNVRASLSFASLAGLSVRPPAPGSPAVLRAGGLQSCLGHRRLTRPQTGSPAIGRGPQQSSPPTIREDS
jgi:hypothetical protein